MMKRLVEEYLIELMKRFNEFGILGPDGQPFKPEEFVAGGNFNYEALQLFKLDAEQPINLADRNESHQNFYALQCDDLESAINEDPLLKAAIEDETLGWINVNTKNENLYPIKALKAMWNHILYPNKVLNGNDWLPTKANKLLGLQGFLRYHAGYLDDSKTTNPDVRYYGIPRIVDQKTLAFSETARELFRKIVELDNPLGAVREMIGGVAGLIPKYYFDKMVATYKETHREITERIPRFKENHAKVPTHEESELLLTKMNEVKKPAQDAFDKYQSYFIFNSVIQKQISEFEAKHPNASNEEKTPFYTSLLDQFTEFEEKAAPTAEEIEADIQTLTPIKLDLAEKMMIILGKEKNVHYLTKELLKAIYITLKTPDLLEKYKTTIADMQLNLHETKRQIQMNLNEVTVVGKTKKLTENKKNAEIIVRDLKRVKSQILSKQAHLSEEIESCNIKHEQFIQDTSSRRAIHINEIALVTQEMEAISHKQSSLYDETDALSWAAWNEIIPDDQLDSAAKKLKWSETTLEKWKKKNIDYEKWKLENENPNENEGWLRAITRNASHYSHVVLSTVANRSPRQELIGEINAYHDNLEAQLEEKRYRHSELQENLDNLEAPGTEILTHIQRLQSETHSNNERIADLEQRIESENTKIGQFSNQFKELLNQCKNKLNEIITQSKNDLSSLQIGPATISRLKSIFENTAQNIGKIKEEYDITVQAGENNFVSDEINAAKKHFEDQYRLFDQNQIKLLRSMITMSEQLVTDYKPGISESDPDAQKNQHIIVLATQLKDLALTYLPQEKTLAEKIQAKENFEKACAQELYSNNAKIAVGVVVGMLSTIVLCAAVTAALAIFFAGGGWLAFIIGAPILAKAGVTAAASSIAIGGTIVGAAVGEHLDEKHSQEYFEQWRFFYENVDKVANETCKETSAILKKNHGLFVL